MNIDHLRYFLVLTQEMHYGRAAQRLNISQSGLSHAMAALEQVRARWRNVIPIVSECTAATDTRFGNAHDLMREMERICDHRVIATVKAAEPIGPQKLLDLLILCPCTGNTLGKLAAGVTDSSVTMAAWVRTVR